MCDGHDIGISIDTARTTPRAGRPARCSSTTTIPAASGSASRCTACTRSCSTRTRALIAECQCESGAPDASVRSETPVRLRRPRRCASSTDARRASWRRRSMDPSTLRDRLRGVIAGRISAGRGRRTSLGGASAAPTCCGPPTLVRRHSWTPLAARGATPMAGGRFVVERRWTPDDSSRRASRRGASPSGVARRAVAPRLLVGAAAPHGAVPFFDLETTGFSGGAGTYAFLVGCGWFDEDGSFVTEQHLLTDYAGERSMLALVAATFDSRGTLVTFNGKSFDAPSSKRVTSFIGSSRPAARAAARGRAAIRRRRFCGGRRRSGAARSAALEAQVLGARRGGDVPGFEIPGAVFSVRAAGDARPLVGRARAQPARSAVAGGADRARSFTCSTAGPDAAATRARRWRSGVCTCAPARCTRAQGASSARSSERSALRTPVRIEALRALALLGAPRAPVRGGGEHAGAAARDARLPAARRAGGDRGARHPSRASRPRSDGWRRRLR